MAKCAAPPPPAELTPPSPVISVTPPSPRLWVNLRPAGGDTGLIKPRIKRKTATGLSLVYTAATQLNRTQLVEWLRPSLSVTSHRHVTLCDPMWHVSSRSYEACCLLLYSVYLYLYLTHIHRDRHTHTHTHTHTHAHHNTPLTYRGRSNKIRPNTTMNFSSDE